jgi:hypothetical protein
MTNREALGLSIPALLAALFAWYETAVRDIPSEESLGVNFTIYGLYVAGFLAWMLLSRLVSRENLIGMALALVIAVTIPSWLGLYGAVGIFFLFVLGLPATGALVASIVMPSRVRAGNAT